jgi:hypothetical protein
MRIGFPAAGKRGMAVVARLLAGLTGAGLPAAEAHHG